MASRTITVEFDADARGPFDFKPAQRSLDVHPGEMVTVRYEFRNVQDRSMVAQAIPSYAPRQAASHFNKLECFCFNEYTLAPGESKQWPVVFVIDPRLPKDVRTITLSSGLITTQALTSGGAVPWANASELIGTWKPTTRLPVTAAEPPRKLRRVKAIDVLMVGSSFSPARRS